MYQTTLSNSEKLQRKIREYIINITTDITFYISIKIQIKTRIFVHTKNDFYGRSTNIDCFFHKRNIYRSISIPV